MSLRVLGIELLVSQVGWKNCGVFNSCIAKELESPNLFKWHSQYSAIQNLCSPAQNS